MITLAAISNAIWRLYSGSSSNFYISALGVMVGFCGILAYIIAAKQFGSLKKLSGIGDDALVTGGIYRLSRNPQFLGWWLLLFGIYLVTLDYFSLSLLLLGVSMSLVQIIYEERSLLSKYGHKYREYMSAVRRII